MHASRSALQPVSFVQSPGYALYLPLVLCNGLKAACLHFAKDNKSYLEL